MTDDAKSAEWDEVGRRFGELGKRLQEAWTGSNPKKVAEDLSEEGGGRNVGAAFDDLKVSITKTVSDPGVRTAAESATSTLTDALAANLRQLAEWIERKPTTTAGGPAGGGDTVAGGPGPEV
jgi:hypothetical protein